MADSAVIDASEVSLTFGTVTALDRMTLAVPRGAVFGFLGPNGAGKTSTLRVLLGLLRATSGTVRVLGHDPARDGRAVRSKLGVLLENDGLYDRLTAYDNLDYHARIHHVAQAPARIEELLRSASLWDRRGDRVATWSKGMRQKLAIARALLHRPPLVLLDEPFTGLDPVAVAELRNQITAMTKEQGVTVFLTTHDLGHVEKICTSVAVLKAGQVIAVGAPGELTAGRTHAEVEVRGAGLTDEILTALRDAKLIDSFTRDGAKARITCSREAVAKLGTELVKRGVEIEELKQVTASLEDAFIALVQGSAS